MDKELKCFFARIGGKSKLVKKIKKIIPSHRIYIEPFVGAGSIFFAKPLAEVNVINDIDKNIIDIYNDVLLVDDFENINLTLEDVTEEKWNEYKNKIQFNNPKERLINKLLVKRLSYMNDGLKYSKKRGSNIPDPIPKFIELKKNFNNYKFKLSNTRIYNDNYENIINNYDDEDSFTYLDPPYSKQLKRWNYVNYPCRNQLFETLKNMKGKFIMSYDECDENINLFKQNFNVYSVTTSYASVFSKNNKEKNEIIITNFEVEDEDFRKL